MAGGETLAKAAEILQESWSILSRDVFSAIENRCSDETKTFHRVYVTKF